jgi:hypothetical protein
MTLHCSDLAPMRIRNQMSCEVSDYTHTHVITLVRYDVAWRMSDSLDRQIGDMVVRYIRQRALQETRNEIN